MNVERYSLVAHGDDVYLVIGFIPRLLKTDLVLREWLPTPGTAPSVITADARECLLVAPPLRPERTNQ